MNLFTTPMCSNAVTYSLCEINAGENDVTYGLCNLCGGSLTEKLIFVLFFTIF